MISKLLPERNVIIIAGMPATGKSKYSDYISAKYGLSKFNKDEIKINIFNNYFYDVKNQNEMKIIESITRDLLFYFCGQLMRTNKTFIVESDFHSNESKIWNSLIVERGYNAVLMLFDGDINVIHNRYIERETIGERHEALLSSGFLYDINNFIKLKENCRMFQLESNKIIINTTDFSSVDYENITTKMINALNPSKAAY